MEKGMIHELKEINVTPEMCKTIKKLIMDFLKKKVKPGKKKKNKKKAV